MSLFVLFVLQVPVVTYAQTPPASGAGAQPAYPGLPPTQDKVETEVGSVKVRIYGTVLLNLSVADAAVFGQELPLWTLPSAGAVAYPDGTTGQAGDNHDLILSARQSVFGFALAHQRAAGDEWTPSGLVEFDFFGTRPVDASSPQNRTANEPRLRLAYGQLERKSFKLVFGQDRAILAPLDPVSLSHVAAPLGATAGNLWAWLPQVRVDVTHTIGSTELLFQAGILRPQYGDPRLESAPAAGTAVDVSTSGLGERSTSPFYEARVAVSPQIRGNKATLGIAAHYGREQIGVARDLSSWAAAFDANVPVDPHVVLRGEAYTGSNLIPFQGGIDQGAALFTPATPGAKPQIQEIHGAGGWGEVTVLPTTSGKNAIYVGAGMDKPRTEDLLPGSARASNLFIWGSYFRKLTDAVTLSAEWSNWQFKTVAFQNNAPGPLSAANKANVVDVSLAYQF
jgi:hypothetical protein